MLVDTQSYRWIGVSLSARGEDEMKKMFLILAFLMCLAVAQVFADGAMFVDHSQFLHKHYWNNFDYNRIEPMSVKYHRVKVDINNGVATTFVDEVFLNDYEAEVEGTYIFPLPEEATIKSFAIYADGKKIEGQIMDKEQASRTYQDMVKKMREPTLLEYVGRNMFRVKIFPIPAHGEKRVELVYEQVLKYENGIYTYDYPLDTERFSPKPIQDVSVITNIKSNIPLRSVYSSSHNIGLKLKENEATAAYEENNAKPDKNFILHYTVSQKDVGLNLMTHRGTGKKGYFMLLVSPGEVAKVETAKDIIFVIDTSGSMAGEKIEQVKNALKFCLKNLKGSDRFNIIDFSTNIDSFDTTLITPTQQKVEAALSYVEKIKAAGGTNINDALIKANNMFDDSQRVRMLIFLTDGEPTVGVTDNKLIVENVKNANILKTRLFVFGAGDDVNTHLLDKLSQTNKGVSDYVLKGENIEQKVSDFYRKISQPVLSDITIDFGQIKVDDFYPQQLPDIFNGTQLILVGRYEKSGHTKIILNGKINGKEKEYIYDVNFLEEENSNDFISRIWATRKVGYLLSELRFTGKNKELKEEIISLSKEYGIMTPYTSYLLDAKEDKYKQDNYPHMSIPLSLAGRPKGLDVRSGFLGVESLSASAGSYQDSVYALQKGTTAVNFAQSVKNLQTVTSIDANTSDIKRVGTKTFIRRTDGVWVDSAFKDGIKLKEIKYFSTDYIDLLKKYKEAAKYFALSKSIILELGGEYYFVKE